MPLLFQPRNQGAWYQIKHHLLRGIGPEQTLCHVSREPSAAPAVGSLKRHAEQQQAVVEQALMGEMICEK